MNLPDLTVVSPDAGGVERARFFAKKMDAALAIVDKRRTDMNVTEVMHVIGDVRGRTALILDDIIDTAGTLVKTADALLDAGAKPRAGLRFTSGVVGHGSRAHSQIAAGAGDRDGHNSAQRSGRKRTEDQGEIDCRAAGRAIESIRRNVVSSLFS